ncbi:hypothetical protein, partial [Mycobacterium avium]|uniref:hypothetical protein n=1 Tax=Mycobacterium avium TaxID=1764 RepID=UPI001F276E1B
MNGRNPRRVIPDTISGSWRAGLSPEFLSPYADGEVANRPVLLHQPSDATQIGRQPCFVGEQDPHSRRVEVG